MYCVDFDDACVFRLHRRMRYSRSRSRVFSQCPRAYFLRYVLPNCAGEDPECKARLAAHQRYLDHHAQRPFWSVNVLNASRLLLQQNRAFSAAEAAEFVWRFWMRRGGLARDELTGKLAALAAASWFDKLACWSRAPDSIFPCAPVEAVNLDSFWMLFAPGIIDVQNDLACVYSLIVPHVEQCRFFESVHALFLQKRLTEPLSEIRFRFLHTESGTGALGDWVETRTDYAQNPEHINRLRTDYARINHVLFQKNRFSAADFPIGEGPWCAYCPFADGEMQAKKTFSI